MSLSARVALVAIRAYQLAVSPFAGGACRFEPSCSEYASKAISAHGAIHGLVLAGKRLARCHPFASAGIDPVPPPRTGRL